MILPYKEICEKLDLSHLEGHESYTDMRVKYYDSDVTFDKLDLDEDNTEYDMIVIDGNLTVNGNIVNANMNDGKELVVLGNVSANNLIAGGAEINIQGTANIENTVLGHYNDGVLTIYKLNANLYIRDDHYCDILVTDSVKTLIDYEDEDYTQKLQDNIVDEAIELSHEDDGEEEYVYAYLKSGVLIDRILKNQPILK
jgi:hypothetical protein